MIRFVSFMRLFMNLQRWRILKTFSTSFAFKGSILTMNGSMSGQYWHLSEFLSTYLTFIRFFTSVDSNILHSYGFSPVWIRICTFNCCASLNFFPQLLHECSLSSRGGAPSQKLGEQGEQNTPKIRNVGVLLHFYVTISESWGSNCTPCTPGCAATEYVYVHTKYVM